MVRIRLRRTGLRHQPAYRVVVADIESPRDGKFLEIVGSYIPTTEPFTFEVKEDRVLRMDEKRCRHPVNQLRNYSNLLD